MWLIIGLVRSDLESVKKVRYMRSVVVSIGHFAHFLSLNNERGISKDFKHILPLLCKLLAIHIWSWHPSLWKKRDQYLKSFVEKKTVRLVFCQGETNFAKFSILAILENSRAKVRKRKLCQNFIIFFLSKLLIFVAAMIF